MTRFLIAGAGIVVMSGWLGTTVLGQARGAKEQNMSTDKGKEGISRAVTTLQQAGELVAYARENQSPVAMVTAVQMLQRVRIQDGAGRVKEGPSGAAEGAPAGPDRQKGKTPAPSLDAKVLLAEARTWAKGNQSLLTLIDEASKAQQPTTSGTLGGDPYPYRQPGRLLARTYKDWVVTMRGGELARIVVMGDGDTDLDLEVFDENGNLIARDVDYSDQCVVQWTPKWTGNFTVRIKNLGRVYNDYILLSN
jgi:hypothetical protein